ncbi:MAG: hypothetical protein C0453_16495 [Comamonadaceae bacterium]|nr:hypothetical protein [Comamonadaceae bacterium]
MDVTDVEIEQCITALYYGGGLTTDPESARRAEPTARRALVALHFDKSSPETVVPSRSGTSELAALSSILHDTRHSPLRAVVPETGEQRSLQMPF